PLSGTYTIGPSSTDFLTFTEAVDSLISVGVGGPVTFNVESGTYTEQISIPEISGASATNTITFQTQSGDSTDVTLTYASPDSATNYTVKLDGADFITFRNMTLSATGTDYAQVVELANGADNNEFLNNRITGVNITSSSYNYHKALVVSWPDSTSTDNNNIYNSNLFQNGFAGIYLGGYTINYNYEIGTQILDNVFENQFYAGIRLINQQNTLIQGNNIQLNSDYDWAIGIICKYTGDNFAILKNKINITSGSPYEIGGIVHVYAYASGGNEIIIANNFIHVHSDNSQPDYCYGILTHHSSYLKIFHNSTNVTGLFSNSISMVLGVETSNCILQDNILGNNSGGYSINSMVTSGINSDYNDLYTNGSSLGNWNSTDVPDLITWQSVSGLDANSISVDPEYFSDSDLHSNNQALKAGTPVAEVTDDIDGDPRDPVTPYIGADEMAGLMIDSLALVALYNSTDGPNWTDNTNWLTGNVSTWTGITVSGNRVTEISFDQNNLNGPIPPEIGDLDSLHVLNLPDNQLTGTIPVEMGNLTRLQHLDLNMNQLTGSIPVGICSLSDLVHIGLHYNQLTGSIPVEMGNLTNLEWLELESNQLTGSIPPEIGNLVNLTFLNLKVNTLSGTIPVEIGNLTQLNTLYLSDNQQLTGSIPIEFGTLTNLQYLDLSFNQLSGAVPDEFTGLTELLKLELNHNLLTDLPDLSSLTLLFELAINNNRFTFEDIEPNIGVASTTFLYSPQDSVGIETTVKVALDSSYTMSVNVGGVNNSYQWYRDGNPISGATGSTYSINAANSSDYGTYECEISNTVAVELTLHSRPIHIIPGGNYIIVLDELTYFENFEDGSEYWTTGGTNSSWEFGTPSGSTINSTATGSNVWMTNLSGDYNANEASFVYSPVFNMANLSNPAIEMKVWWDNEGTYDGACLQYSEDTAKTWHTLLKSTGYLWYNRSDVFSILNVTGSGKGWSGDGTFGEGSNGWVTVRNAISGPGDFGHLQFRFVFASNGTYENDGFAFDDVRIYSDPAAGIAHGQSDVNDFEIYPNPGNGIFTLTSNPGYDTDVVVEVMNLNGRIVTAREFSGTLYLHEQIDLSSCPKG
ncbi:MAG: leucine-rich repeat domain-containing protein, partial [Bacteroidales bacterium]